MRAHPALAFAVLAAVLAAACSSPATNFYALGGVAAPTAAPEASVKPTVAVGPVAIPAVVDRPQLVLAVGANQMRIDEFNRWAAPLADNIAGVIVSNLAQRLGGAEVWLLGQGGRQAPTVRVSLIVQRFEIAPADAVVFEALWSVQPAAGQARSGRTVARESVPGPGIEPAVAAQSRALARVSDDIAAAILGP